MITSLVKTAPFVESPGDFLRLMPYFKISNKEIVVQVLAQKPVHSVSFPDIFIV